MLVEGNTFRWEVEVTSECSAVCGAGTQSQRAYCVHELSNKVLQRVDDAHCRDLSMPSSTRDCYKDCAGRKWVYGEWGTCSVTCGSGLQKRNAMCVDSGGNVLDGLYCENMIKEALEQSCNTVPCPYWSYGDWSMCSQTCDGGIQVRRATCVDAAGREIDDSFCDADKRLYMQKCNEVLCTNWKFGAWSECSKTCGEGLASRSAWCVDSKNNVLDDSMCIKEQKIVSKPCHVTDCPHWQLGEWSQCSQTCLDGWQSRQVSCFDSRGEEIDARHCSSNGQPQPPTHQPCNLGPCPFWKYQEWSPCSVTCGNGTQTRVTECVFKNEVVDAGYCKDLQEPERYKTCQLVACPEWEVGPWEMVHFNYEYQWICLINASHSVFSDLRHWLPKAPDSLRLRGSAHRRSGRGLQSQSKAKDNARVVYFYFGWTCDTGSLMVSAIISPVTAVISTSLKKAPPDSTSPNKHDSPTTWEVSEWSECSASCGSGEQRRYVACRDVYSRVLPNIYCSHEPAPERKQVCTMPPCGRWHAGPWQMCSSTCGVHAKVQRKVVCLSVQTGEEIDVSKCNKTSQPPREKSCSLPTCPVSSSSTSSSSPPLSNSNRTAKKTAPFRWFAGEWSEVTYHFVICHSYRCYLRKQCSSDCGVGWQQRLIVCLPAVGPSLMSYCPLEHQPPAFQLCQGKKCYKWKVGDWKQCSKSCDGGQQVRLVECVTDAGNRVPNEKCKAAMPESMRSCSTQKCPVRRLIWRTGKWSPCSSSCGRGVRTREVYCFNRDSSAKIDDLYCANLQKPAVYHRCRTSSCPKWRSQGWSHVSRRFFLDHQSLTSFYRSVRHKILHDSKCNGQEKPPSVSACHMQACPFYRWVTGEWSPCSRFCGEQQQIREVYCDNNYGQRAPPSYCDSVKKPVAVRLCLSDQCPFEWSPGPWTSCSKTCGTGEQYRTMSCVNKNVDNNGVEVPVSHCAALPQPVSRRHCSVGSCEAEFYWQADEWSECSVTCGWGVQVRRLRCVSRAGKKVDRNQCDSSLRPRRRRRCMRSSCEFRLLSPPRCQPRDCAEIRENRKVDTDGTYDVLVNGQRVSIYCFGMNTHHPKEYLSLSIDFRNNFAEFYPYRLLYPFTCPHNGQRNDSCECSIENIPRPGLTRFRKVRIDLHNMKINRRSVERFCNDLQTKLTTFQGQFNIDLSGTGFKISEATEWTEDGHRTSKIIELKMVRKVYLKI
ncbi:unnamed protein product [Soboliphyme baturini]|uniref:GON domain-containing protein n=1 Tax=Soboliphyme baturini TaxID=241478 RepID=A0A3P8EHL4_9BILA|nr:unnamed protein product [Soboliphyme baturini]